MVINILMTNLFGSLDIEFLGFIEIWYLGFEISEYLNTRDNISKDYPSVEYSTVKFHTRVEGLKSFIETLNFKPRTLNSEP